MNEAASSPSSKTPPSREQLKEIQNITSLLSRTALSTRLYNRNNEIYRRFWNELRSALSTYLTSFAALHLEVGTDRLCVEGEQVYSPKDEDDLFTYRLYKEGLREIEFSRGLKDEELARFLDIITTDFDRTEFMEQDIVSLIWESDFKHIRILSVDAFVEEMAEEDDYFLEAEAVFQDLEVNELAGALQQTLELHVLRLDIEERNEYRDISGGMASFEERSALASNRIYEIDPVAQQALREEVAAVEKGGSEAFERSTWILFEVFRQCREEEWPDIKNGVTKAVHSLLRDGELDRCLRLLQPIRTLADPEHARAFEGHERIRTFFHDIGSHQSFRLLETHLEDKAWFENNRSALFSFISLLPAECAPHLVEWLNEMETFHAYHPIVDGLIVMLEEDLTVFHSLLRSKRGTLVAETVRALGKLADPQAYEIIMTVAGHESAQVRLELLLAIQAHQSPRAREQIGRAIEDPDIEVRLTALRLAALRKDQKAGKRIESLIEARHFAKLPFREIKALLMALAYIRGKDAQAFLQERFEDEHHPNVQRGAAHALAVIGGADNRRLLESGAREAPQALAEECTQALRTINR